MSMFMLPLDQKARGAYYTNDVVARFLAAWSIQSSQDTVLEPSFGDGAFLRAATFRLRQLGGNPDSQIFGSEIDPQTHDLFCRSEAGELGLNVDRLELDDFFARTCGDLVVSTVIGNPPFVRFHRFAGQQRDRALQRSREAGVNLSELSSSWAPFVVHATRFLRPGGRLAMVLPIELIQAVYARPVLAHLVSSFARLTVLTFDRKLFPHLSQDTVLLLADGFGEPSGPLEIHRIADADQLVHFPGHPVQTISSHEVDGMSLERGLIRAAEYRISPAARDLYRRLSEDPRVQRLGKIANVGIGYVTGANDFFHLSDDEARAAGIRAQDLLPAIRRGRDLAKVGLSLNETDWEALRNSGGKHWLFCPPEGLNRATEAYVLSGENLAIQSGYKCRNREPWWKVPWVITPDLVLNVMSGSGPRLVANGARAVATNTLHTVRLHIELDPMQVAAASINSLTLLSAEVEGHALGGGMLKLEPSEAERLVLPVRPVGITRTELDLMDLYIRKGSLDDAVMLGNKLFLFEHLGLTQAEIQVLQSALDDLRRWRTGR